ncbi:MAG: hypothetical protein ABF289_13230 [Clostridiales bacterium]
MEKRNLPRHVSGSFKFLNLHISGIITMIVPITTSIMLFNRYPNNSIVVFFIILIVGLPYALLVEYPNKQTGIAQLLDFIKYQLEGTKKYERSCMFIDETKKFIKK